MSKSAMLITVLISAFWFYHQSKYTTFGKVLSETIKESEQINQIEILWTISGDEKGYTRQSVVIDDTEMINKLLKLPTDMELKRINKPPGTEFWMTLYTDTKVYGIVFGEGKSQIGDHFYHIIGENILEQAIQNERLEWKIKE